MWNKLIAFLCDFWRKISASLREEDNTSVFYIGGSEVLPPPLSQEEEKEYLNQLSGNECEEAKKKLISHNLRLVVYLARKFENTGVGVEDLISIGTIGLIKGIHTFNPEKNIKLATYASRCIENEILMHLRRTNKLKLEVSFDEPLNMDWDGNELLLSDILGTDEDIIYRDLETEAEIGLLRKAMDIPALWRESVHTGVRTVFSALSGKRLYVPFSSFGQPCPRITWKFSFIGFFHCI